MVITNKKNYHIIGLGMLVLIAGSFFFVVKGKSNADTDPIQTAYNSSGLTTTTQRGCYTESVLAFQQCSTTDDETTGDIIPSNYSVCGSQTDINSHRCTSGKLLDSNNNEVDWSSGKTINCNTCVVSGTGSPQCTANDYNKDCTYSNCSSGKGTKTCRLNDGVTCSGGVGDGSTYTFPGTFDCPACSESQQTCGYQYNCTGTNSSSGITTGKKKNVCTSSTCIPTQNQEEEDCGVCGNIGSNNNQYQCEWYFNCTNSNESSGVPSAKKKELCTASKGDCIPPPKVAENCIACLDDKYTDCDADNNGTDDWPATCNASQTKAELNCSVPNVIGKVGATIPSGKSPTECKPTNTGTTTFNPTATRKKEKLCCKKETSDPNSPDYYSNSYNCTAPACSSSKIQTTCSSAKTGITCIPESTSPSLTIVLASSCKDCTVGIADDGTTKGVYTNQCSVVPLQGESVASCNTTTNKYTLQCGATDKTCSESTHDFHPACIDCLAGIAVPTNNNGAGTYTTCTAGTTCGADSKYDLTCTSTDGRCKEKSHVFKLNCPDCTYATGNSCVDQKGCNPEAESPIQTTWKCAKASSSPSYCKGGREKTEMRACEECKEEYLYTCTDWSSCVDGTKTKTCTKKTGLAVGNPNCVLPSGCSDANCSNLFGKQKTEACGGASEGSGLPSGASGSTMINIGGSWIGSTFLFHKYEGSNRRIGIGTGTAVSPAEILEISDASNTDATTRLRVTDLNHNPELQLQYGVDGGFPLTKYRWSFYVANKKADGTDDDKSLRIWGLGGDRFIIDTNGNVHAAKFCTNMEDIDTCTELTGGVSGGEANLPAADTAGNLLKSNGTSWISWPPNYLSKPSIDGTTGQFLQITDDGLAWVDIDDKVGTLGEGRIPKWNNTLNTLADSIISELNGVVNIGGITADPGGLLEISNMNRTTTAALVKITDTSINPELQLQYGSSTDDHWRLYVSNKKFVEADFGTGQWESSDQSLRIWGGSSTSKGIIIDKDGRVHAEKFCTNTDTTGSCTEITGLPAVNNDTIGNLLKSDGSKWISFEPDYISNPTGGTLGQFLQIKDNDGLLQWTTIIDKIETLTENKWCSSSKNNANELKISCTNDPPVSIETDPKVGTLNGGKIPKWNSATSKLEDSIISESDNKISIGGSVSIGGITADPGGLLEINDATNSTEATARVRIKDINNNPELQLKYGTGDNDYWAFYVNNKKSDNTNGDQSLHILGTNMDANTSSASPTKDFVVINTEGKLYASQFCIGFGTEAECAAKWNDEGITKEEDPKVGTLTTGYIPRWNEDTLKLENSALFEQDGKISIGLNGGIKSSLHVYGGQKWGADISLDATGVKDSNNLSGQRWSLISTAGTAPEGPGKFLIKDVTTGDETKGTVRLSIDKNGNISANGAMGIGAVTDDEFETSRFVVKGTDSSKKNGMYVSLQGDDTILSTTPYPRDSGITISFAAPGAKKAFEVDEDKQTITIKYFVANTGTTPLTNIKVDDTECGSASYVEGDIDSKGEIAAVPTQPQHVEGSAGKASEIEWWVFTCTTGKITKSITKATATAQGTVKDTSIIKKSTVDWHAEVKKLGGTGAAPAGTTTTTTSSASAPASADRQKAASTTQEEKPPAWGGGNTIQPQ